MRTCHCRCLPRALPLLPFSHLAVVVLAPGWAIPATSAWGESKSHLSEVVEQAKKPVEEQEFVQGTPNDGLGILGILGIVGIVSDALASSSCSGSPSSSDASFEPRDASWERKEFRSIDPYIAVTPLHLRLTDGVLSGLIGFGLESGARVSPRVDAAFSVYLLSGNIDPGSQAYGALQDPTEIAGAIQVRVYLTRSRLLGLNGSFGLRHGHLSWKYRNPVFVVDEGGYGREIWDDSIEGLSGFAGIGITPIRSDFLALSLDLGVGWRTYIDETNEGFANDMFRNGRFIQASIKVVIPFF